MPNVPLYEYASVVLDQNGNGRAQVGPISAREVWNPSNAHVSANQNPVNDAFCTIFAGDAPTAPNFRDQTYSGSSGDQTDSISADIIKCGHYIFAVWANGDPGALATLTITGTKTV